MNSVVVIGSLNMDFVVQVDDLPKPGQTVLANSFFQSNGGKGGNQAVAASRAGGKVALLGSVGDDKIGRTLVDDLLSERIDVGGIHFLEGIETGLAFIQVNKSGQNSIVVNPGANCLFKPDMLFGYNSEIENAGVLLASLEIPAETIEAAFRMAGPKTIKILNPAPAIRLSDSLLRLVDWITPNETETEILTGIYPKNPESMKLAADVFHASGVKNVVLTLGEVGVFVSMSNLTWTIPAPEVKAIDWTAAGDIFNGCLAAAFAEGSDAQAALSFAVRSASISVTRVGAQRSAPYRNEI